jgi:taurine dioxygenase
MFRVTPSAAILGATVDDIDLARPLDDATFDAMLAALGEHGVLRFPNQSLTPTELRDFSMQFGSLQIGVLEAQEPGVPEVSILSNIVVDGQHIGLIDAGQDWHTDMSYNPTVGFVNVLFAMEVPVRDGKPLGATSFINTQAACTDLSPVLRAKLEGRTATHHLARYWDHLLVKGSRRKQLGEERQAKYPPVSHPILLRHPITGCEVIYINPGFTVAIDGMGRAESDALIASLFDHMMQDKYRYTNEWSVHDVLMWDNLGTWHMAIADYGESERRLMKRCQVAADKIFLLANRHV